MKKFSVLALAAIVAVGVAFTACDSKNSGSSVKLVTAIDSVSYIVGKANAHFLQKNNKMQMEAWPAKGNYEAFIAGIKDALKNPEDSIFLGKVVAEIDPYINNIMMEAQAAAGENNKAEGDRLIAQNKTKSGVITTESGLQYKVITEGTGAKAQAGDVVKLSYAGKLLNGGTEFDNSELHGGPQDFTVGVGNYIPGFDEGLMLMPIGSKYIIYIPVDLAYGLNTPNPQMIPVNSALEFEVELIEIVK